MSKVVEFNHISKQYRLGLVSSRTLSHDIDRWWKVRVLGKEDPFLRIGDTNDRTSKGNSDYVWALQDIDFKISQGDVVGIIGKNGAGKSTLLKILSRITAPTTGDIKVRGRIGSLLEVGTGFHPEMTGRENIYMNGAILGMTKREISGKLDEIIDFSGCERYIDTPVKRYSSGMMVRLGFAVAAHLDPEILVVDEVLAVGDAEFQKKAIGKMKDVSRGEGRTVLFVSHNMASIRALCKTGVVLDNGQMAFSGSIDDAIGYYLNQAQSRKREIKCIINNEHRDMNRSLLVRFLSIEHLKCSDVYASDEDIVLGVCIESDINVKDCRINCTVFSAEGVAVCNNSSTSFFDVKKGEKLNLEYTLINPGLVAGVYTISFSVGTGNMTIGETNYDVLQHVVSFEIDRPFKDKDEYYVRWNKSIFGDIYLKSRVRVL